MLTEEQSVIDIVARVLKKIRSLDSMFINDDIE